MEVQSRIAITRGWEVRVKGGIEKELNVQYYKIDNRDDLWCFMHQDGCS
jgi:hypothetical protein